MKVKFILDDSGYSVGYSTYGDLEDVEYDIIIDDSNPSEVEALGMKSQFYHIVDGKVVCDYDKYHAWEEVVKLISERSEKLRLLDETDYINSKLVDKLVDAETWEEAKTILSSDEYSEVRLQRQAARDRINELETQICVEKYLQYWKKEELLSGQIK